MKKSLLSVVAVGLMATAFAAGATQPGNNGNGNGGCGQGQQTNGCPGGGAGGSGGAGGDAGAAAAAGALSNANATGGTSNATGGTGIGVGLGGAGGSALSGSLSGVIGSGNSTNDLRNTQGQQQGQQMGQGQIGVNQSANNVRGGDQSVTGGAQSLNATNGASSTSSQDASTKSASNVTVDASSGPVTYRALAVEHAPIVHGQAAPALATATMVVQPGVCGPRHYTETKPVYGTHHGILWDSSVAQGHDYTVVPATTPFIMKDGYLIGHKLNEYVAVVGTSSAKSFSLQGFNSSQAGGGGGAANSGSHQQIVVRVTISDCLMQTEKAPVAAVVTPAAPVLRRADRN